MIKKWDAATTTKFVQEYAKHTCLWDVNSENYKSRAARDDAVLDIVRNMGMNDLHPNDVKCKIRIIRNTYINEMKKIREKKKLVGGKHVNYVCNIPWFKTADQFLRKVVRKKQFPANLVSLDSIDDDYEHSNEHEEYSVMRDPARDLLAVTYEAGHQPYSTRQIKEESIEDSEAENASRCSTFEDEPASSVSHSLTFSNLTAEAQSHGSYFSSRSPVTSSNTPYESTTFRRTSSDKHPFNEEIETTLGYSDEFDIFAKNVGVQLRQLPLENALEMQAKIHQLLIAERLKVIRRNKRNGLVIEDDNFDDISDI